MAEANDGSNKSGWVYWLGRVVVWLFSTAVGTLLGALIGGLVFAHQPALLALFALTGLCSLVVGIAASSLSLALRDMVIGLGLGVLGGTGFILFLAYGLPSC